MKRDLTHARGVSDARFTCLWGHIHTVLLTVGSCESSSQFSEEKKVKRISAPSTVFVENAQGISHRFLEL
jgi:hypothetical protein